MNVGIYTPWQQNSWTLAAIQIADLISRDHSVYILSPTQRLARISPVWDRRVVCDAGKRPAKGGRSRFTDWFKRHNLDVVIWVCCGRVAQAHWVRDQPGRPRTILVASCCEDDEVLRRRYVVFDRIVAPSVRATRLLIETFRMQTVVRCPWSPLPGVTSSVRVGNGPLRLYMPLHGPGAHGIFPSVRPVLEDFFNHTDGHATVVIDRRARGALTRSLVAISRLAGGRLRVLFPGAASVQSLLPGTCDLTCLLSVVDPFNMQALLSLHAGTPVLTFDGPAREVVQDGESGIIVSRHHVETAHIHEEDAHAYATKLIDLAFDPSIVRDFRYQTAIGLSRRRRDFTKAWSEALHSHS